MVRAAAGAVMAKARAQSAGAVNGHRAGKAAASVARVNPQASRRVLVRLQEERRRLKRDGPIVRQGHEVLKGRGPAAVDADPGSKASATEAPALGKVEVAGRATDRAEHTAASSARKPRGKPRGRASRVNLRPRCRKTLSQAASPCVHSGSSNSYGRRARRNPILRSLLRKRPQRRLRRRPKLLRLQNPQAQPHPPPSQRPLSRPRRKSSRTPTRTLSPTRP